MEKEIKQYLIDNGMHKQTVESKNVEKTVELMLRMFTATPVDKAKGMLDDIISEKQALIAELECKVNRQKDELQANVTLKRQIKEMLSPRAKETLALYGSLIDVGKRACGDSELAMKNAGYAIYAYLGGEARTIITDDYED